MMGSLFLPWHKHSFQGLRYASNTKNLTGCQAGSHDAGGAHLDLPNPELDLPNVEHDSLNPVLDLPNVVLDLLNVEHDPPNVELDSLNLEHDPPNPEHHPAHAPADRGRRGG